MKEVRYQGKPMRMSTIGVTSEYFLMYNGGCRRVAVRRVKRRGWWVWIIDEAFSPGSRCHLPGKHPHPGKNRSRRVR